MWLYRVERVEPMSTCRTASGSRRAGAASRLAAVLAAVGLIVTACGGGDGDDSSAVGDAVGINERGGDDGDGGGGDGDGDGDGGNGSGGGDAGAGGEGRPAEGGEKRAAANEGEPLRDDIPAVGLYTYQLTFPGSDADDRRYFEVDQTVGGGDYIRQLYTVHHGGETAVRTIVSWRMGAEDGMWVEFEQKAKGPEVGQLCSWDPQYQHLRYPMAAGQEWSTETRCYDWDGGSKTRTETVEVVGRRQAEVDGQSVPVWEIRRVTDTVQRIDGGLETSERVDATELWSREHGLVIRSDELYTNTVNGAPRGVGTRTAQLVSLRPEPIKRG